MINFIAIRSFCLHPIKTTQDKYDEIIRKARIFVAATKVRRRQYETGRLVELHPRERWAWIIADILDAIQTGIAIREARKTWWERVGKRILRILEAVVLVAGHICGKRLPIKF